MLLYFAYGSNMYPKQMQERCPGAQPLGPARLKDWQFFITKRGTANIRAAKDKHLYGVLWHVTLKHIAYLDYFEGRAWKNYHRHILNVTRLHNLNKAEGARNSVPAHIYVSTRLYPGHARPVYMRKAVLLGAAEFNFPDEYVDELESWLPRFELGYGGRRYFGRKVSIRSKKAKI